MGVLLHGRGRDAPPGEGEKRNAEDGDESKGTGGRGATPRTGTKPPVAGTEVRRGDNCKGGETSEKEAGVHVHFRGWVHLHECALTGTNQKPCVRLRFCFRIKF